MSTKNKSKKIGLALGSGAARGLAHIGVLKCLEENNISLDYISGSSIGAIIGALYASNQNILEIEKLALQIDWRSYLSLIDPGISGGLIKGNKIRVFLKKFIKNTTFKDLSIPLIIAATDFQTGEKIYLTEGNLIEAIMASSAIPLVFKPNKIANKILVDGGLSSPLPIEPLKKQELDIILAVNLDNDFSSKKKVKFSAGGLALQTVRLLQYHLARLESETANLVISPAVGSVMDYDFTSGKTAIKLGYEATKKVLPKIKALIKNY